MMKLMTAVSSSLSSLTPSNSANLPSSKVYENSKNRDSTMSGPSNSATGNSHSSIVSLSIRSEIHRFESVHPSIYSIYELLDQVNDAALAQAIREHVVNIEDCFVNSQEWTLSRSVSELHVGLLGSQMSPKSTLVHRYLTATYVQDNSPEGGRFKKEIILNNTPYLLLLRDEGGPPELQFSHWTDALILVASSTQTTNTCFSYITRFANYRSLNDIPIVLVSVEENIAGSTPASLEFIKEFKKIPHVGYFHCNVRTGMNVDMVFSEVCNMIVNKKVLMPPPSTNTLFPHPPTHLQRSNSSLSDKNSTPISTPTTSRKFRRRSNLFKSATQDLGSGRTIPIKQGYLLKKSNNSNSKITNKKWKKKYVTISEGKIEYFDHINQYMDNPNSGKPVELKHVTVKLTRNNAHNVKTITDSLSTLSLKKQSSSYNVPPEEAYGFQLVSISKQWDFETNSKAERDEWVELIEEQIVKSLQANISDRVSSRRKEEGVSEEDVGNVKKANSTCADCNAVLCKGGYWASLNLCVVVCIACSGVHRNLGTHLSKIRSMELDEMSNLLIAPLKSIESNGQANRIYEASVPNHAKPDGPSNCTAEERSTYIRRKYKDLEFLPREPSKITNEMVTKSILEKDFWRFLLYVNLIKRESGSNSFWLDGTLLNLALSNEFTAAAQIIVWITNDVQQQEQTQAVLTSTPASLAHHQQLSGSNSQRTPSVIGMMSSRENSNSTPFSSTNNSKLVYNKSQSHNAQYYSVATSSSDSSTLPCSIISSSNNKLNIAAPAGLGGVVGSVTAGIGGISTSRVLNNNNDTSNTSNNGGSNLSKKFVI